MNDYLVAVELCTSKVAMAVAEAGSNGIKVVHHKVVPVAKGMSRGDVQNSQRIIEALARCKHEIEQEFGETVTDVILCAGSQGLRTVEYELRAKRSGNNLISQDELLRWREEAFHADTVAGEMVLDAIPQTYDIDDSIGNPPDQVEGMSGKYVIAKYRLILGKINADRNKREVVESCGMNVVRTVLSPVGSAMATLNENERENGVALLDIGAGTTDVVVVKDNIVRSIGVIPFAGNTITSDIRYHTCLTTNIAEVIKMKYGNCIDESNTENKKLVIQGVGGGETKDVSLDFLQQIVEARVSEILEAAYYLIEKSGYINKIPTGLVITGGTAYLEHIKELARAITGMRVRLANAQGNISESSKTSCFDTTACSIVGALIDSFEHESEIATGAARIRTTSAPTKSVDIFAGQPITKLSPRERRRKEKEEKMRLKQQLAEEKAARKEAERKAKLEAELAEEEEDEEEEADEEEEPEPVKREPSKIEQKLTGWIGDLFTTSND
ncbi:MAG: cell division protein FtsA [Bacteroidales bacterium]|nr:cell division protein FtsA [Bacteroidales bacterium]